MKKSKFILCLVLLTFVFLSVAFSEPADLSEKMCNTAADNSWYIYSILLFAITFVLGILAVLSGVGGGVLFVPIISGFFPFHLDFVRTTGLLIALAGSLAASPSLLKKRLASIRLSLPIALITSTASIAGAVIGLSLPGNIIQTGLGITILFIVFVIMFSKKTEYPEVTDVDAICTMFKINGIYYEETEQEEVRWKIHNTIYGFILFIVIGIMAGMFGLGAGWANVPVLNLVMGVPLKLSVGTSQFLISITDSTAAWVYINSGAVIPMIIIPSVTGMMIGSTIGAKILVHTKPQAIKYLVIFLLFFAGIRALLKGLEIWK